MLLNIKTIRRALNLLILPAALMILFTACGEDTPTTPDPDPQPELNLAEVLSEESDYSTLASLVPDDLLNALQNDELTVFAPTNAAFNDIPSEVLQNLTDEDIQLIITYHLVAGTIMAEDVPAQGDVETVAGELILVQSDNGVTINGSSDVVEADIAASNGVIHGINEVLLPSDIRKALGATNIVDVAQENDGFETLLSAIESTGLTTTLQFLGPFTTFAPTDAAFANLPDGLLASLTTEQLTEVLLYHVIGNDITSGDLSPQQTVESLSGESLFITANGGVTVNGASAVIAADVDASNGTIHAIDEVLIPNAFLNIVEIAQKNYELTTLVDLVIDADLAATLSGEGPFTVFAPINSAFEDISEALEGLTAEEVSDVLTYHVIEDYIESGDIPAGETIIPTVNGESVTINNSNGTVTVNGANVITVDLAGTNGVIHLIDAVLLPEN
jgi:transforming growth factor-beta-induced protein